MHKNEKSLIDYYDSFWTVIEKEDQTDEIDEELVSFSTFTSYILNIMFNSKSDSKNQFENLSAVFYYYYYSINRKYVN